MTSDEFCFSPCPAVTVCCWLDVCLTVLSGKTMIARAIASAAFARFYAISGGEIVSRYVGESEQRLTQTFQLAHAHSPAVIFIDEIDSLCPSRDTSTDPLPKRLVATLLTLMDGMGATGQSGRVVVLAATNRPDAIDAALRRPGRFDREVEIGIPNERARRDIVARMKRAAGEGWQLSEQEVDEVAKVTHGYVGADLKALCREAAMAAMKRHTRQDVTDMLGALSLSAAVNPTSATTLASPVSLPSDASTLQLTYADFLSALPLVRPSSMRSITLDVPTTRFSDIGGQHDVKQRLHEAVHWPLTNPAAFTRLGIQPPRGILLYGPPGCSKTLMARALACESGRNFIAVKGPELFSKWVGESEKAVREVFRKARAAAPSIVFFDEVDSIAASRAASSSDRVSQRVLSQLLSELDGLHALRGVVTLAATNRPDLLDAALLRPGRIDRLLYVAPPQRADAVEILQIEMRRMATETAVTGSAVMAAMEARSGSGSVWSGAELSGLCREAGLAAMEEDVQCVAVGMRHFERALERMQPRLDSAMLHFYDQYAAQHSMQSI